MEQPIVRTVLREEIKARIIERIVDGTYGPGDRIVESQLAKEFGTSQAPVREALRDLEGQHLIESRPHKGARVRELSPERLFQVYPVRAALEELAAQEAASRMTDDVLDALAVEVEAMREAASDNDPRAQMVHDTRFHEIIVETAGNEVLLDTWRALRVETGTLVSVIRSEWDLHMVCEMHRPVLQALRLQDPALAGSEARAHIEFFGNLVRRHSDPVGANAPARP
ncbi:DNA-binding GntR family transcriptional regulator [Georgenia soli]|uniref:DNA-binding GntR family transcriptional regulator n=1 Tax=Georgenia soli TaxID=638953 RepID=A0A2A9EQS7_9MICO|nr:GntR family transcriptional regulator [Georgenia soli]PFG41113.1 DNA-binding GntR family transcriptional regulator [Georgenia soli]